MTSRAIAPAATRIAVSRADARPPPRGSRMPVFRLISEVGMAGPERRVLRIVAGPRIDIVDHQADRRPGRAPLDKPRTGCARGPVPVLATHASMCPAGVLSSHCCTQRLVQLQPRRATVDDAADCRPMALAPSRHPQQMAEAIPAHRFRPLRDRITSTNSGKLVAIISAPSTAHRLLRRQPEDGEGHGDPMIALRPDMRATTNLPLPQNMERCLRGPSP